MNITGGALLNSIPAYQELYEQYKKGNSGKYIFDVAANYYQFSAKKYGQNVKIMTIDGKFEAIYNIDTGEQELTLVI